MDLIDRIDRLAHLHIIKINPNKTNFSLSLGLVINKTFDYKYIIIFIYQ